MSHRFCRRGGQHIRTTCLFTENNPETIKKELTARAAVVTGIPAALLQWNVTKLGKPFFLNAPGFHFSISHSRDVALLAFGHNPVGADIEHPRPYREAFGRRFFTENECAYIESATLNAVRNYRFLEIWTRKEAYLKCLGVGLHMPLRSFDVLAPSAYHYTTLRRGDAAFTLCESEANRAEVCP
jgi:4'-phosphopantetheinyl transferase